MKNYDMRAEALEYSTCYLDWFNNRHREFFRGADIFRDDHGRYRLISSGCRTDHQIVDTNISSDQFGDVDGTTTVDELADMLVHTGFMTEMLQKLEA